MVKKLQSNFGNRAGLTLVEIIVAIAISSILLIFATSFLLFGNLTFKKGNVQFDKQSDIRIASDYVANQIQYATFIEVTDSMDDGTAVLDFRERIYFIDNVLIHEKYDIAQAKYVEVYRSPFTLQNTTFKLVDKSVILDIRDDSRIESDYKLSTKIDLPNIIASQTSMPLNIVKFSRGVASIGLISGGSGGVVTGLSVSPTSAELEQGHTLFLTPTISTSGSGSDQSLTWTSSNEDIATVNSGMVTAKTILGNVTITVTSNSNPSAVASCEITVITATSTDVTPPVAFVDEPTPLYLGETVDTAKSSETGHVYLINQLSINAYLATLPEIKKANLDLLVSEGKAKVSVAEANTNTVISTTGLTAGTYFVYAVDEAGNVSTQSANSVTIKAMGPIVTDIEISSNILYVTFDKTIIEYTVTASTGFTNLSVGIGLDNKIIQIKNKKSNGGLADLKNTYLSFYVKSNDSGISDLTININNQASISYTCISR